MSSADKLISRRRACEVTGLSKNTLVRLEQRQLFPPKVRVGSRVFYSLVEVLDWVRARKNGRSVAWQDVVERREHRRAETEMFRVQAELNRMQIDELAHSPRYKKRCSCGASLH